MIKLKMARPDPHADDIPERPKRSMVVRIGIGIVGMAVLISSLVPLFSMFQRQPSAQSNSATQLEEAARLNPTDAALHVTLGNAHYDAQRYAEAAKAYQIALALKPGDSNVQVDYGTSLFYSGRAEEAIKEYRAVSARDPKHFQARVNLGVVYRSQGKVDEAIASWRKAEELAPDAQTKQRIGEMIMQAAVTSIGK